VVASRSEQRANWGAVTVTALTVAWVGSMLYFFGRALKAGLDARAAYYDGPSPTRQSVLTDVSAAAMEHMVVVLAVGPVVIVIAAAIGRLKRTAIVFSVIAVPALLLGGLEQEQYARQHTPAPPPGYDHCVERSGGDTRCPGG
jgi:hypothetical protein